MDSSARIQSLKRKSKHKGSKTKVTDDIGSAKKQKAGGDKIDAKTEEDMSKSPIYELQKTDIEIHSDDENDDKIKKKPKKSKKKKRQVMSEGKKSEDKSNRLLKREKEAHRKAEIMAAEQIQMCREAEDYLFEWKNNRQSWKFRKGKQVWLMKNKFDEEKVHEEMWPIFIEYFSTAIGNVKKYVIEDANKIIEKMEEWLEKNKEKLSKGYKKDDEDISEQTENKPSESVYKRARDIIQNITE